MESTERAAMQNAETAYNDESTSVLATVATFQSMSRPRAE
jgi:hypothetical protein